MSLLHHKAVKYRVLMGIRKAVKTLPTSIEGKRIPEAEAPHILSTTRNKREGNGHQEVYQQGPCMERKEKTT
eukprot:1160422-Pelagomonas_calceolata.AAC.1